MIDLDDTRNCPPGDSCANCGGTTELDVCTFDTVVGVICMTLCAPCVEHQPFPRHALLTAALMAATHCEHLGIDLDQAAAVRAQERGEEPTS